MGPRGLWGKAPILTAVAREKKESYYITGLLNALPLRERASEPSRSSHLSCHVCVCVCLLGARGEC